MQPTVIPCYDPVILENMEVEVEVLQISELPPHTLLYEPEEHIKIGGQVEEGEKGGGRLLDTQDPYKGPPTKELWHLRNILFKFQHTGCGR